MTSHKYWSVHDPCTRSVFHTKTQTSSKELVSYDKSMLTFFNVWSSKCNNHFPQRFSKKKYAFSFCRKLLLQHLLSTKKYIFQKKKSVFSTNSVFYISIYVFSKKRNRKVTNFFFSFYSFSEVWPVNLMKLLIHGRKIRFHISQTFLRIFERLFHISFFYFHHKTQYRICILIYWLT